MGGCCSLSGSVLDLSTLQLHHIVEAIQQQLCLGQHL